MANSKSSETRDSREPTSPSPSTSSSISRGKSDLAEVDDPESVMSTVARLLEELHASMISPSEKEVTTKRLLELAKAKKEARILIGSHGQAMPLLISTLRVGTTTAKINAAMLLSALCKEEDLRMRVLLGGCIPPLLALLKCESAEAKKAAAKAIYEVSSGGLSDDHIGRKIFVTEGVVPTLWDLLNPRSRQDRVVEGYVTGALRNLCGDKDGYWKATLEAGGVEIITGLLSSKNTASQSNAASLLARFISAFSDSIPKIIDAGGSWKERRGSVADMLGLSSEQQQEYAVSLLAILSDEIDDSKWAITAAGGIPPLVQLLETGSQKAKEDAAHIMWNMCSDSDDIRACIESAGAAMALIWLLKSGSPLGQ